MGVVPLSEALQAAQEADLDLVEVSPAADPPVVRIMDYGKFLYERARKEREARKAHKQVEVKELRLRPKIAAHHLDYKIRQARQWLEKGAKVKVTVHFRGREVTYPELGQQLLTTVAESLADVSDIERKPKLQGFSMQMVLTPKRS